MKTTRKKRKKFEEMNQVERITYWKKKLDEVWSWLVRDRDRICMVCDRGRPEVTLFGHHWFLPKTYSLALRWNLLNGVTVCYGCHKFKIHLFATYCYLAPMFKRLVDNGWYAALQVEADKPKMALAGAELESWLSARFMQLDSVKKFREEKE